MSLHRTVLDRLQPQLLAARARTVIPQDRACIRLCAASCPLLGTMGHQSAQGSECWIMKADLCPGGELQSGVRGQRKGQTAHFHGTVSDQRPSVRRTLRIFLPQLNLRRRGALEVEVVCFRLIEHNHVTPATGSGRLDKPGTPKSLRRPGTVVIHVFSYPRTQCLREACDPLLCHRGR